MAADVGVMSKPRFIVLGGCGFIGRNFVQYLIENDIASEIRVVDKVPPQTAWLNPKHQKTFDDPRVVFRSANLINSGSCEAAFAPNGDSPFDYAVNCACETKPGQTDPVYKEGILKLSINCANEAAKQGVKRFIELSDGHMCSSDKAPFKEDGKPEPWTYVAKWKCQVEEELKNVPDLKYTVVRPGIVYGLGDRHGLAPRLVIGAVYRHLGEMMKLLWGRDLRMNTVHVEDVCRAILHLAQRDDTVGQVYHVVDSGDTTQGDISSVVSDLFDINHDYWGNTLSSICKLFQADMSSVVEEVNDKHMGPWAEACARDGVENTPLTPYIDQELLYNKHLYLDNSKLLSTGFELSVPRLSKDKLKEILTDYSSMKLFPHSLIL
ncbi:uncharacterized protein LOC124552236 isoform X1 [Schistocerca americana]|uniref:uncharacterized protein LOC124552236 isoform X1 n=1 Tax=Schistocerca americana TaxID=7009 RepID=UPI001F4F19DE|nr:uncharacterized protein LOC124552236 isoform X1 [Schistocerca americana]XP_047100672.1 uncharacterized protein LOC124719045 isoform X1 [Schistocerca piceifrons]XP_049946165.1 uncharacterized protein LOC126428292 isoform X1 [Schistocerca serialis cubense]